jgi:hypothetical protein
MPDSAACPLCGSTRTQEYLEDKVRSYNRCSRCDLVFVPPAHFLSPEEEKRVYDMHENNPADAGYRQFLSRLHGPMSERLPAGASGLDFGSGPGPTLSLMFEEQGHAMCIYDPFYAPDNSIFERRYDFITATEVVEHLHRPGFELDRLWSLLHPGGLLGLMTKRLDDRHDFAAWHYKNDPTHVVFFSRRCFEWLSAGWGTRPVFPADDVVILQKPGEIG